MLLHQPPFLEKDSTSNHRRPPPSELELQPLSRLPVSSQQRQNEERNKAERSALKTAIKKANIAVEAKAEGADVAVKEAVAKIDKAAGKGLLHKNNAARKKSALVKKLNKA